MSEAMELLDSLTEVSTASATEEHVVIGDDRYVVVPAELKRVAVQYDHNVETVIFDCPRYWDEHDLSTMIIYINNKLPDGKEGSYIVDDAAVDDTDDTIMHFSWVISRNVTAAKGNLSFQVCIKDTDEYGNEEIHWNSEINKEMYISPGMECGDVIIEQYSDIITQLIQRVSQLETRVNNLKTTVSDLNYRVIELEANAEGDHEATVPTDPPPDDNVNEM